MIPLDDSWRAFDGVHGGLVVAWLLEEAAKNTDHEPVAITTHFLSPVQPIEAKFATAVERAGRSTSSVRVRLEQDRVRAHGVVELGVDTVVRLWSTSADLGGIVPPEDIDRLRIPAEFVPFSTHIDIRPISPDVPGSLGKVPFYETWIRMINPDESSALGSYGNAAVLLDALPPGLLATWAVPRPVPTVEMSVHFAPDIRAESEWFHIHHATSWATDAWCVEDTTLRTRDGLLVAQARQSRRIA